MCKKFIFSAALSTILISCSSSKETKKDGTYLAKLSGLPQLEVKNEDESAIYASPNGDVISIVGDDTFTTTYKKDAYKLQVRKCNEKDLPPVWLRYYDGPNTFAYDNFEEISFDMPVTKNGLPAIYNLQSLWDQMIIFQPMPVFEDLAPTYCGFYGAKTLWANGGINFELTAGNTGFDLGDATAITAWNSPWKAGFNDTLYKGWTVYPIMALGNGAGGVPAGYAFRIPADSSQNDFVHCKYTILNDKQIVIQELSHKGATTKYAIPQQLFKDKFLPQAIANGDMKASDKQVDQIKNFDWRWLLFTTTLTIQKPFDPDGKLITLDELKQYFPKTSAYQNIKLKVKGFEGINNPKAFKNTLKCELGLELYGTLWDDRVFTDLKGYSKWLATEADKQDPRYAHWRCVEAIARSREQRCIATGSEKNSAGIPWNVENGYLNEEYPEECDCNNPKTKAIIDSLRKESASSNSLTKPTNPSDKLPSWLLGTWMREWIRKPGVKIQNLNAVQESPQLVRYLQTPKFFGDMRYPIDRPNFHNAKSFDDLTDSDLQILAKQQGFIGYTTVENPGSSTPTETVVQWHRQMDFEPSTSNPDIGKLELLSNQQMNESALDNTYTEHWVSLSDGDDRFLVVRVEREGRIDRMLLVAGDQFYYGRNRAKNLPAASSFDALISQASRDQIIEYLDFELSVGRVRGGLMPWEIQYSTLPWREGMHLDFVDRIQGSGSIGGLAIESETGETWTVPTNTLDPKDVDFIFPKKKEAI